MAGFRGYMDRMIARFSHDGILPWQLSDELYKSKSARAGF